VLVRALEEPSRCGLFHEEAPEPLARDPGDLLERAGLLEEMRGAGDDLDALLASEPSVCPRVQVEDRLIGSPDDEQGGTGHTIERLFGEVGSAATRDYCTDSKRVFSGCN